MLSTFTVCSSVLKAQTGNKLSLIINTFGLKVRNAFFTFQLHSERFFAPIPYLELFIANAEQQKFQVTLIFSKA